MTKPRLSAAAQTAGFLLLVAITLFGAAGRLDIPMFWLYLAVLGGVSIAGLLLIDEDLAQERMRPGGQPLGLRLWLVFFCASRIGRSPVSTAAGFTGQTVSREHCGSGPSSYSRRGWHSSSGRCM